MFSRSNQLIEADLGEQEADLVRQVIHQYLDLIDHRSGAEPDVVERLFPAASDDPKVAADFQELSTDSLAREKREAAETALGLLGGQGGSELRLSEEEADAWLRLLTDLRLSIGTRIGVTEETMATDPDPEDPEDWPLAVLHYLGALQESLVGALSDERT